MTRRALRRFWSAVAAVVVAGSLGAHTAAPAAAGGAPKPAPLRVLVTNDDGVSAPGIDELVKGLRKLDRVRVTVVASPLSPSAKAPAQVCRPTTPPACARPCAG